MSYLNTYTKKIVLELKEIRKLTYVIPEASASAGSHPPPPPPGTLCLPYKGIKNPKSMNN